MRYQREILKNVEGYTPGEQLNDADVVKLNTNENPYPPSTEVVEALRNFDAARLRKYPDPVATEFRRICAARYGLPGPEWLVAGNGSDELLSLTLRTFVDPGDVCLAPYPTYSLYEILCALHGCELTSIPLDAAFGLTPEVFQAQGRLLFLTRPNAPTGVSYPREEVARLCEAFPGIVLIDEAYADFAQDHCMDFVQRFDNVIVLRTFSKSFGLAGMRIGVAAARPELIQEFMKTKDSYNLNGLAQAAGIAAMQDHAYMQQSSCKIAGTRNWLAAELSRLGFEITPSQANFILAHWHRQPGAKALYETLRDRKILVRYFDADRLRDSLRITVGTPEECQALISALEEILAG